MNDRIAKERWYPKLFQYRYSILRYGTVMSLGKPKLTAADAHPNSCRFDAVVKQVMKGRVWGKKRGFYF